MAKRILSIDDLTDLRSSFLLQEHNLDVREIYPLSTEINLRLVKADGKVVQKLHGFWNWYQGKTEGGIRSQYQRMLASAVIVSHELNKTEQLAFEVPSAPIPEVSKNTTRLLERHKYTATRAGPPEIYSIMAWLFQGNLDNIDYHRPQGKIIVYARHHRPPWT